MTRTRTFVALATTAAVLVPAVPAFAASYPPPGNPGKIVKPRGKAKTLRVCKDARKIRRKQCFKTIQAAVDAARPRDVIRVSPGTYRESVLIATKNKSGIKLIGDPRKPRRVVLSSRRACAAPSSASARTTSARRTRSRSTAPTASRSTASPPSTTRPTGSSRST